MALLVFDFDGTLVDSNGLKARAFVEAADFLSGAAAAVARVRATPAAGDRYATIAAIAAALGRPDAAGEIARRYDDRVRAAILTKLADGWADAFLAAVGRAGHRACVNSATPEAALADILTRAGLDRRLAAHLGGFGRKTKNLRAILAAAGVDTAVVIGDGADDAESARACGCRLIAVDDRDNALFARPPAAALAWIEDRLRTEPPGATDAFV
ncbi:MAG: HAD family hydrolase [Azospirillum sp.]|nr:HAD family hydrolase [Azospirillum sp.]